MNKTPLIFGREPAVIGGLVEATLALLVSFGMLNFIGIDGAQGEAVVMAVVFAAIGLYVAIVTKDTLLGALLAVLKAGIALLAFYHYDLSQNQIATLLAIVPVILMFIHRQATEPDPEPSLDLKSHSVPRVSLTNTTNTHTYAHTEGNAEPMNSEGDGG